MQQGEAAPGRRAALCCTRAAAVWLWKVSGVSGWLPWMQPYQEGEVLREKEKEKREEQGEEKGEAEGQEGCQEEEEEEEEVR